MLVKIFPLLIVAMTFLFDVPTGCCGRSGGNRGVPEDYPQEHERTDDDGYDSESAPSEDEPAPSEDEPPPES